MSTSVEVEETKESSKRRRLVSLTITEACNLSCSYCYEHSKTAAVMDIQVAKDILKHEFENSDGFDEIEIDLFGGEPTLYPDFIKELVNWTRHQTFTKPFIFFLQTNGTLVHEDLQKWLLDNKSHVNVGLSLDGTPATHDRNRNNSYDLIDIDFFVRNYPAQGVRMTISADSIGSLAEDVIYLYGLGFSRIDSFFAYGIDWKKDSLEDVLSEQLLILAQYYLDNPDVRECSIFDMPIHMLNSSSPFLLKWCGTGVEMVSIGVDGKKYPCHAFQPNTNSSPIELGGIKFNDIKDFSDPECHSCMVETLCPNCYGINHLASGDMLKRDKQICSITKIRVQAVAWLRAHQIGKGIYKDSPGNMYNAIEVIKKLQNI